MAVLCFLCQKLALETVQVPGTGWGEEYPRLPAYQAQACEEHAPAPPNEAELIRHLLKAGSKKATLPDGDTLDAMEDFLRRLGKAMFQEIYRTSWLKPVVVITPRLGIIQGAEDLAEELQSELRDPIKELFPEEGPHTQLDFHFFETETEDVQDYTLWLRLPGGLQTYIWPGEL